MAFVTKTWKDRLVEYAGRRKLKNVATGEEVLMDVSRSEGTVSQAGDAFSAANMNNLEQRIKNEFDTVNSSLNGLSFAQDADGNWGYKVGADAVIPFKSGNISYTKLSNTIVWSGPGEWRVVSYSAKIDVTQYNYLILGRCIFTFGYSADNTTIITIKYEDNSVVYDKTKPNGTEDNSGYVIDTKNHTEITIYFSTNFNGAITISGILGIN